MAERTELTTSSRSREPIPETFGFDVYLSPYTYKYGSMEMRRNWSEKTFWLNVRDIQIAGATV